jgi:hypothetical protein
MTGAGTRERAPRRTPLDPAARLSRAGPVQQHRPFYLDCGSTRARAYALMPFNRFLQLHIDPYRLALTRTDRAAQQ